MPKATGAKTGLVATGATGATGLALTEASKSLNINVLSLAFSFYLDFLRGQPSFLGTRPKSEQHKSRPDHPHIEKNKKNILNEPQIEVYVAKLIYYEKKILAFGLTIPSSV